MMHLFAPLLALAFYLSCANALVNVTIDDSDPFILYQPPEKWQAAFNASCSGGGYSIGHDSCVNATIQCDWVSFYYLSPLWPFPISTEISIDGGAPIIVDLQDHSVPTDSSGSITVGSTNVFAYHGTESKLHTILVSGSAQNPYAVVDAFIFETDDGQACHGHSGYGNNSYSYSYGFTTTVTTTTTTTQVIVSTPTSGSGKSRCSGTPTAPPSTYSSPPPIRIITPPNHSLIIGICILGAVLALFLICLLLLFAWWRRRRDRYGAYGLPRPGSSHGSLNPPYGGGATGGTYGETGTGNQAYGAGNTLGGGTSGEQPYMRETS